MRYFKGPYFHTPQYGELVYQEEGLIVVDDLGMIQEIVLPSESNYQSMMKQARASKNLVELQEGQYFLPGFIDLHIHAPQWPQAGIALDRPLNVWLNECTFPLEAKYSDIEFSHRVYQDLVRQLLRRGTTTALYFASVHKKSSLLLAEICGKLGQRGLVGKVVMDHPEQTFDYYRDVSTKQALIDTEWFIQEVLALKSKTKQGVYPVVTPRFVPSCTDEVLVGLGALAQKYNVHIQSHCSEGQWEHDFVKERFKGKRDTEVLNDFGLLGPKSVMAHCNFLDEGDGAIFAQTHTAIAHCPISNAYFANAVLPARRLHEQGVQIGLGTDISGGFSPSLYENIRQSVMASRILEDGSDVRQPQATRGVSESRITLLEAFYYATTGGGKALDLPIGVIAPGYACDLQVIDTTVMTNPLPNYGVFNSPQDILERIVYLSTLENIRAVYVQGELSFQA